jgi:hypothetical protein
VEKTEQGGEDSEAALQGEFSWTIEGMNKLKQQKLYSPVFQSGQYNWCAAAQRHAARALCIARPERARLTLSAGTQAHPAVSWRQQRAAALGVPRRGRLGHAAAGLDTAGALFADRA